MATLQIELTVTKIPLKISVMLIRLQFLALLDQMYHALFNTKCNLCVCRAGGGGVLSPGGGVSPGYLPPPLYVPTYHYHT